ncbi:hypothetical protein EZV62_001385 [Acer yangbiense]|uniref:HAT C-terminal dimerisation domain-containing protein n=1 Tax=Acer yangbiense TaxID=1000413 RepID=A0A5C7IWB0_9ROSI|nr:hypothetical protein EZV62_001385 [Acer yangbiense]
MVRPGVTRFASTFLTLQSLVKKNDRLRAMFTSTEWEEFKFANIVNRKMAYSTVMSIGFWNGVNMCLRLFPFPTLLFAHKFTRLEVLDVAVVVSSRDSVHASNNPPNSFIVKPNLDTSRLRSHVHICAMSRDSNGLGSGQVLQDSDPDPPKNFGPRPMKIHGFRFGSRPPDSEFYIKRAFNVCRDLVDEYTLKFKVNEGSSSYGELASLSSSSRLAKSICRSKKQAKCMLSFDAYVNETNPTFRSKLDAYLEEKILPNTIDFDILTWWKENESNYPILTRVARDVLTISYR